MFCALLDQDTVSGERLQDHWSSGYHLPFCLYLLEVLLTVMAFCLR